MSKSPLYRAAADLAQRATASAAVLGQRATSRAAGFAQRTTVNTASAAGRAHRATARLARKHSRLTTVAASAATVGVLGAAGFAAGAAPWAQAIDNVTNTVSAPQSSSAQVSSTLFAVMTGTTTAAKPATGTQLDAIRSAATGGSTASGASTSQRPKSQATAVATNVNDAATQQAAKAQPAKSQAAKATAAKATAAKPKATKPAAAKPTAAKTEAAKPKAPATPAKPYLIYDSVTPSSIPAGQPAAVYVDGEYATSWSQVAGHSSVLWIDTNGSDPHANVLDVEPGDATPAGAAQWVKERLTWHSDATAVVYTMLSDWQEVKADVAELPAWMQSKVQYWIADPTGVPHVVPGASATQWYWGTNYDITTAEPGFAG